MPNYISLNYGELAVASVLVLVDAGLSLMFRLGIHRSLLIAAVRMTVQLTLVGMVLTALFAAGLATLDRAGGPGDDTLRRARSFAATGAAPFGLVVLRLGHRLHDDGIGAGDDLRPC